MPGPTVGDEAHREKVLTKWLLSLSVVLALFEPYRTTGVGSKTTHLLPMGR